MSAATFYAWKAKFGGMDASDAKRLKEAMLDQAALKDLLSRKW